MTFSRTQASVLRVNIAHRKTQTDQKLQSDRTYALDKRIDETNVLFQSLWDRIEGAYDNSYELRQDLASFEERLNVCQAAVHDLESQRNKSHEPVLPPTETSKTALVEREDVQANVDQLISLVQGISIILLSPAHVQLPFNRPSEMKALRDTTANQVEYELSALKATRAHADAKFAELNQVCSQPRDGSPCLSHTMQNTCAAIPFSSSPLKRKRDVLEDEDKDESEDAGCAGGRVRRPSPPKRIRRVASAVVHTAAAVTVGAVAAWSALAFA